MAEGSKPASGIGASTSEPVIVDGHSELTNVELLVLELERSWWKYQGAKESVIRERLDMSLTRYYQVLNALIDRPGSSRGGSVDGELPASAAC